MSDYARGEALLNELNAAIGQTERALTGNSALYQQYEDVILQARRAHSDGVLVRQTRTVKSSTGVVHTYIASPDEFNRVAQASYSMWMPKLQEAFNAAKGLTSPGYAGASTYIHATYSGTPPPSSPLDFLFPTAKEEQPSFLPKLSTLVPAYYPETETSRVVSGEIAIVGAKPAREEPDTYTQGGGKTAKEEVNTYVQSLRTSSNPAAEAGKPGEDRLPAYLQPDQMMAFVGMMFAPLNAYQQQRIYDQMMLAQAQGQPVQAPAPVLQMAQAKASEQPWELIAILGIGVLAVGALIFMVTRAPRGPVVYSAPVALPTPA